MRRKYEWLFWAVPHLALEDPRLQLAEAMLLGILYTRTNAEHLTWPSQKYLANKLHCTERSIRTYVHHLEETGWLKIERVSHSRVNGYRMTIPEKLSAGNPLPPNGKSASEEPETVTSSYKIDKEINKKKIIVAPQSGAIISGKEVNTLLDLFKEVNPTHYGLFNNKTERAALERMVHQHGREKIEKTIQALPELISRPFCPKVTTPYQLEKKLGELVAFWKQEQHKTKRKITVAF